MMALNMFGCLSILLITVGLQAGKNLAIRIDIQPSTYDSIKHDNVNITCTPDGVDVVVKKILFLQILKDSTPIVVERSGFPISFPNGIQTRFAANGHIADDIKQSYLNLILKNVESSDYGQYSCVMYFVDQVGLVKMEKSSMELKEEQMNIGTLKQELEFLKTKLLKVKMDLKNEVTTTHYVSAFSATLTNNIDLTTGQTVVFGKVLMLQGLGYDSTTGIYTAPRNGLYAFHLGMLMSRTGGVAWLAIQKNGVTMATVMGKDLGPHHQSSCSTMVNLTIGDRVKVVVFRASGSPLLGKIERGSSFTGYLMQPL